MVVFRFKHFEVRNELAAQKVGTDAVLLGAALTLPDTTPQTAGDVQQERSDKSEAPRDQGADLTQIAGDVQQERSDESEAPGVPGAEPPQTAGDVQHLLDIGTGTGVIALMVAQRLADRIKSQGMSAEAPGKPSGTQPHFKILAIDIDPAAASEATANFAASPWAPSLHAEALSLNDLEKMTRCVEPAMPVLSPFTGEDGPFAGDTKVAESCERRECRLADALDGQRPFPACHDETNPFAGDTKAAPACPEGKHLFAAIFSNPPYFEASLKAPDARRSTARHTDTLSYREICAFAASHLTPDGILSLILPASEEQPLLRYATSFGLRPFRILRIRTTARKPASRIIAEFRRTKTSSTSGDTSHASSSTPINNGRPQNLNALPAEELILMSGTDRSPAYAALTKDFYL